MSSILSFEEARHLVEQHAATVRPRGKELVALLDSQGLILAVAVAHRKFPSSVPSSHARRICGSSRRFRKGPSHARRNRRNSRRRRRRRRLQNPARQAAAIMTGAPAPAGSDAVVMVEYTSREGNQVTITKTIAAGKILFPSQPRPNVATGCCLRGQTSRSRRNCARSIGRKVAAASLFEAPRRRTCYRPRTGRHRRTSRARPNSQFQYLLNSGSNPCCRR